MSFSVPETDCPAIASPVRFLLLSRISGLDIAPKQLALVRPPARREYCQRRGWTVAGEYVDLGVSGTKVSRPQLDRLMRDARLRQVDVIAVWKLDRFGRSLRHLVDALGELQAVGVAFVSLRDNLDLSTPAGRMLFHVVGAMAEFERDLISERVNAGMGAAKKKGVRLGRPRVMADARKVAALRAQGLSWKLICSELALSKGTAQRAFYDLAQKGGKHYGRK